MIVTERNHWMTFDTAFILHIHILKQHTQFRQAHGITYHMVVQPLHLPSSP